MACNSLVGLPRACAEGVVAGLEKVYIIATKDLKAINTGTTAVYSANTSGTVVTVGLQTGKTYVEIGLLKSTSGLNEKLTKDNTKGTNFMTQTFTLVLSDITVENTVFMNDVKGQPVSIIYKTRQGNHYVVGLNGQFEVTNIEGGTGTAEADLIGHTITFEGISQSTAPLILDSVVASIIS